MESKLTQVEEKEEKEEKTEFPCLRMFEGKYGTRLVVIFRANQVGTVVYSEHAHWSEGDFSTTWDDLSDWKKLPKGSKVELYA